MVFIARIRTNLGILRVDLGDATPETTTLLTLRKAFSTQHRVPCEDIFLSLESDGAVMGRVEDDNVLSSFGIKHGSLVQLLGKIEKIIHEKSYVNDEGEVIASGVEYKVVDIESYKSGGERPTGDDSPPRDPMDVNVEAGNGGGDQQTSMQSSASPKMQMTKSKEPALSREEHGSATPPREDPSVSTQLCQEEDAVRPADAPTRMQLIDDDYSRYVPRTLPAFHVESAVDESAVEAARAAGVQEMDIIMLTQLAKDEKNAKDAQEMEMVEAMAEVRLRQEMDRAVQQLHNGVVMDENMRIIQGARVQQEPGVSSSLEEEILRQVTAISNTQPNANTGDAHRSHHIPTVTVDADGYTSGHIIIPRPSGQNPLRCRRVSGQLDGSAAVPRTEIPLRGIPSEGMMMEDYLLAVAINEENKKELNAVSRSSSAGTTIESYSAPGKASGMIRSESGLKIGQYRNKAREHRGQEAQQESDRRRSEPRQKVRDIYNMHTDSMMTNANTNKSREKSEAQKATGSRRSSISDGGVGGGINRERPVESKHSEGSRGEKTKPDNHRNRSGSGHRSRENEPTAINAARTYSGDTLSELLNSKQKPKVSAEGRRSTVSVHAVHGSEEGVPSAYATPIDMSFPDQRMRRAGLNIVGSSNTTNRDIERFQQPNSTHRTGNDPRRKQTDNVTIRSNIKYERKGGLGGIGGLGAMVEEVKPRMLQRFADDYYDAYDFRGDPMGIGLQPDGASNPHEEVDLEMAYALSLSMIKDKELVKDYAHVDKDSRPKAGEIHNIESTEQMQGKVSKGQRHSSGRKTDSRHTASGDKEVISEHPRYTGRIQGNGQGRALGNDEALSAELAAELEQREVEDMKRAQQLAKMDELAALQLQSEMASRLSSGASASLRSLQDTHHSGTRDLEDDRLRRILQPDSSSVARANEQVNDIALAMSMADSMAEGANRAHSGTVLMPSRPSRSASLNTSSRTTSRTSNTTTVSSGNGDSRPVVSSRPIAQPSRPNGQRSMTVRTSSVDRPSHGRVISTRTGALHTTQNTSNTSNEHGNASGNAGRPSGGANSTQSRGSRADSAVNGTHNHTSNGTYHSIHDESTYTSNTEDEILKRVIEESKRVK